MQVVSWPQNAGSMPSAMSAMKLPRCGVPSVVIDCTVTPGERRGGESHRPARPQPAVGMSDDPDRAHAVLRVQIGDEGRERGGIGIDVAARVDRHARRQLRRAIRERRRVRLHGAGAIVHRRRVDAVTLRREPGSVDAPRLAAGVRPRALSGRRRERSRRRDPGHEHDRIRRGAAAVAAVTPLSPPTPTPTPRRARRRARAARSGRIAAPSPRCHSS